MLPRVSDALPIPVTWHATDAGSGVASYSVQVRDRAGSSWSPWLSNTTATLGLYPGTDGHSYEFRVSAVDRAGNAQAWVASMADPGSSLTVSGFASVSVPALNVRAGAGTGFTVIEQLAEGATVAILAGPVVSGGYTWYQVQFGFSEWPSADYPRVGWAAAGSIGTSYLIPIQAPTVTTVATITPFVDIGGTPFVPDIKWLYDNGITTGCAPTAFCPNASITRGEMAAFLDRTLHLPTTSLDFFSDDNGTMFEADINRLAAAGITVGCGPSIYCPSAPVGRDQMASFLVRAASIPASSADAFTDDEGNMHEADINALAAAGVTTGCAAGLYCPGDPVTRGQMAAFLHRAFG